MLLHCLLRSFIILFIRKCCKRDYISAHFCTFPPQIILWKIKLKRLLLKKKNKNQRRGYCFISLTCLSMFSASCPWQRTDLSQVPLKKKNSWKLEWIGPILRHIKQFGVGEIELWYFLMVPQNLSIKSIGFDLVPFLKIFLNFIEV